MTINEIERKYELRYLPLQELPLLRKSVVERKYLSSMPEIRINKRWFEDKSERCHLTIKSGEYLERMEMKFTLTQSEYAILAKIISAPAMIVDIYEFDIDTAHPLICKCCRNPKISFAEIEYDDVLTSEIHSTELLKYKFIGKEVTFQEEYYMRSIWLNMSGG